MIPPLSTPDFQKQLQDLLQTGKVDFRTTRVGKQQNVYLCGDRGEAIYFIDRGLIKLLVTSPEGADSIIAIRTKGEMFGESCLATNPTRAETATAMEYTIMRHIPSDVFLSHLIKHSLIEKFVQHLIDRMLEQQQFIAHSMTLDKEHMLAWTILLLARKLGTSDPPHVRLEYKITHQELSEMVGTTRPRITEFMRRFRDMGLIEMTSERLLVVNAGTLSDYLAHVA